MAIVQEGTVLAGIRGNIGNVVIYPWKSKVCTQITHNQFGERKKSQRLNVKA